jgi:hypothetical protein
MNSDLGGRSGAGILESVEIAPHQVCGTWKWKGATGPADLEEVVNALRQLPGVTGLVLTLESLRLTYDADLFQEAMLASTLHRLGRYEITAKISSRPVVEPRLPAEMR